MDELIAPALMNELETLEPLKARHSFLEDSEDGGEAECDNEMAPVSLTTHISQLPKLSSSRIELLARGALLINRDSGVALGLTHVQ